MIKKLVKEELLDVIKETLGPEFSNFEVDHPQNESFGDFTLNVALKASKVLKQNPLDVANRLSAVITAKSKLFEKAEVVKPGFINLTIKKEHLLAELKRVLEKTDSYGTNENLKGKRVVVEYTDPNPFKEFHIGHLYSNIVGQSLVYLKEASGATVFRANYFGDVGMHVAKSLWGLIKKLAEDKLAMADLEKWELSKRVEYLGQSYALGATAYEENPAAQAEIKELNVLIFKAAQEVVLPQFREKPQIDYDRYRGQTKYDYEEIKNLYAVGRAWSLEYFETIYQRLGTKFDGYFPESRTGEYGYGMVLDGLKKGVFEKGENGAIIFPGSKYGLHDRVFINSLGLPTYETKDFGNAVTKNVDFSYDASVIVTGNEINDYFHVVLKALRSLYPELGEKTVHIGHGMVRLPEGKMSSRTGKVVRGEWLLDEASKRALAIVKEADKGKDPRELGQTAEVVGTGAVKYALLKGSIGQDVEFNFAQSISFEGNCGPYLQYTYARAKSVLRKSEARNPKQNPKVSNFDIRDSDLSGEETFLLRTLYKFPEVVEAAAQKYQPHLICNFLFDLAQKFNLFYNNVPILPDKSLPGRQAGEILNPKSESFEFQDSIFDLRLDLTSATAQIIKNGLSLLGIQSPERM